MAIQLGASLPVGDIGTGGPVVRDYAQTLEGWGIDYIQAPDHVLGGNPAHGNRKVIMPLQTGYQAYGRCGLVVGDWFRHIGMCADDLAIVLVNDALVATT